MGNQYDKFLTLDNFHLAFKRLQTVDGFTLYKNLYRSDIKYFGFFLYENIELLIHNIRENIYIPENGIKLYIPKKNNLVRPLTLLNFHDLLVYQALINVIADVVYDELAILRSKNVLFGNAYRKSDDKSKIFFLRKWKDQWKNYNVITEKHFKEGYIYFTDFDIASFFDTISHDILSELLYRLHIDEEVIKLLKSCLAKWSVASNRNNICSGHGIPQGPVPSSILADIYLIPIDKKVNQNKNLDVKYQRYVDDIRILTKHELEGKKAIAYLDLLARDYGLIPQSTKIGTRKIENIKKELSFQHTKFSTIATEYHHTKSLTLRTHIKLKKQFLNCFKSKDNEDFLNKTIIRFALFKLNEDNIIRKAILDNIEHLYPHFDAVLYYLVKHYKNDENIQSELVKLINGDTLLFQHVIALVFKEFKHIVFSQELFEKHYEENKSFWLIKYFVLDWLLENQQYELIQSLESTGVYYLDRKILKYKVQLTTSQPAVKSVIKKYLISPNNMLAVQALYYYFIKCWSYPSAIPDINPFVNAIINQKRSNVISHILSQSYETTNADLFFNNIIWNDVAVFSELKANFYSFFKHLELDPSIALMSLNLFNEQVFDKLKIMLGIDLSESADYGGSIPKLVDTLPVSSFYFEKINNARNQKTLAHYKDKQGNIRIKISFSQMYQLLELSKFKEAMIEICSFNFNKIINE